MIKGSVWFLLLNDLFVCTLSLLMFPMPMQFIVVFTPFKWWKVIYVHTDHCIRTNYIFIHTIANTVSKDMNLSGTSYKTQPHHKIHICISFTTISTTKISYTICISKVQVYSPKKNDCVLRNTTLVLWELAHEHKKILYWLKTSDNLKILQPFAISESP